MIELTANCVFLLDIEGTTTSISYVTDILFPYAFKNLESHLESNWSSKQLIEDIDLLREQSLIDVTNGLIGRPLPDNIDDPQFKSELISYVKKLINGDVKCTALKQLQGHIWKDGFESGLIRGHVYDDVPKALERWANEFNCDLYIYSSGSIEAQKLHFGNTIHGNLLPHIKGHFDTTTGPKQDAKSYEKIVETIKRNPEDVVFLTDIPKEAMAARSAGLTSVIVCRPGNKEIDSSTKEMFPIIKSFDEIQIKMK